MSVGLKKTFEVLAATGNEAAVDVLVPALDSQHVAIQEHALRALLDRWSALGQREILRRWSSLHERLKQIIAERPGRIHDALRESLLSGQAEACAVACDAILWTKDYDLLPTLLTAAEDRTNLQADQAARTLLALAEALYEELAGPRDYRVRRDPQIVRQHVLASLEASVGRYDHHRRSEILEAFLLLSSRDNASLKAILLNPHERCYLPLLDALATCARPGVMRLMLAMIEDPYAPLAALNAAAHRTDEPFLRHFLKKIGAEPSASIQANLRRMERIPWLQSDLRPLLLLSEAEQQTAVTVARLSGLKRQQVFDVVKFLLRNGNLGGRRAASEALAEFSGVEANQLALDALADPDPQVQVNILVQLRERGIPGAMTRLLELVDTPHLVVQQAVRQCLSEFTFQRFLAAFDMLAPHVRVSTGALVRKVDPQTIAQLEQELASQGRTRRLRALQIAQCLRAEREVEAQLIELLADEDPFVRIETAHLLVACDSTPARQALRGALLDRHAAVKEAAERSLRALSSANPTQRSRDTVAMPPRTVPLVPATDRSTS